MQSHFIPPQKRNQPSIIFCAAIILLLSACGGGGGSGGGSPTPTVISSAVNISSSSSSSSSSKIPAPTLTITNTEQKIKVGETGSISITTTNATSCTEPALGAIPVNGSVNVSPTKGGRVTYTISCTGDGGAVVEEALVVTPFPVYKTSYENKMNVELDSYVLPQSGLGYILGPINDEWTNSPLINGIKIVGGFSPRSIAFADFLQNGTMVAIVANTEYKNIYPNANKNNWPDSPGKLYFLQQDPVTKKWTDISAQLFKNNSDRQAVVSPGFFQVADLNNDGKPDLYIAGWGPDFPLSNNDYSVMQSDSYVVLSQIDGSYKSIALPFPKFFAHQSSLADIDGDGNVDIITTNNDFTSAKKYIAKPMVMWGHGDGTFSPPDLTVFPNDTNEKSSIFGLTAIPIDEKINIVLSGENPNSSINQWAPGIYGTKVLQYVNGKFEVSQDLTASLPKIPNTNYSFSFVINAAFDKNHWVFLLIDSATGGYKGSIAQMDHDGGNASIIHTVDPVDWSFGADFKIDYKTDTLLPEVANCNKNPTSLFYYCDLKLKLNL